MESSQSNQVCAEADVHLRAGFLPMTRSLGLEFLNAVFLLANKKVQFLHALILLLDAATVAGPIGAENSYADDVGFLRRF